MSAAQKLTKKQKKALAFRERKTGKGKGKDGFLDEGDNDVPVLEDQDIADQQGIQMEAAAMVKEKKKSTAEDADKNERNNGKDAEKASKAGVQKVVGTPSKRKRQTEEVAENSEEGKQVAKRKRITSAPDNTGETAVASADNEKGQDKKATTKEVKQRFILFVGNLKYTTSLESIKAHFSACDPPPTIRLLTPKSSSAKPVHKSKGCAFLEFSHRNALQQALKLHQSELEGRMINVELTAGGGGKSDNRLTKLKERNKELFGQRKDRIDKQGLDGDSIPTMPDRPQRYSATSGIEQAPVTRRTWTVGDVVGDEKAHRGKRHAKDSKGRRPRGKEWGTGVNAIPVG